jgi:hypothetical protein
MNQDDLSYVEFGDVQGLKRFAFENYLQHQLFFQQLNAKGVITPFYPIGDIDPSNIDDWLLIHNQMHESLANILNLDNPFQLLDADFNVEDDFYDWLGVHSDIHTQIATALGVF